MLVTNIFVNYFDRPSFSGSTSFTKSSDLLRRASTLVIADHNNEKLSSVTLKAITAAKKIGGDVACLVAGVKCSEIVQQLSKVDGIKKILIAENEAFNGLLPERITPLVVATQKQFNFSHIISGASAFGKVLSTDYLTKTI